MVNEVVNEEKRLLSSETTHKAEALNHSMTPMSTHNSIFDLSTPNSASTNLQQVEIAPEVNSNVLTPFSLPALIPQQDDMEFEREEQ